MRGRPALADTVHRSGRRIDLSNAPCLRDSKKGAGSDEPALCRDIQLRELYKTLFRKAKDAAARDDEVIQHADINQCQRLDQAFGDQLVGVALILYRRRVIVDLMCPGSFCAAGDYPH